MAERSSAGYVDTGSVSGAPGATDAERAAWLADKIVAQGDYAKEAAAMLRRWPSGTQERPWTTLRIACGDGVYIRIRRLDGEVRVYKESPGPTGKRELQRMLTVSIGAQECSSCHGGYILGQPCGFCAARGAGGRDA